MKWENGEKGREGEERRKTGRNLYHAGKTLEVCPARLMEDGYVNSPVSLRSC